MWLRRKDMSCAWFEFWEWRSLKWWLVLLSYSPNNVPMKVTGSLFKSLTWLSEFNSWSLWKWSDRKQPLWEGKGYLVALIITQFLYLLQIICLDMTILLCWIICSLLSQRTEFCVLIFQHWISRTWQVCASQACKVHYAKLE